MLGEQAEDYFEGLELVVDFQETDQGIGDECELCGLYVVPVMIVWFPEQP